MEGFSIRSIEKGLFIHAIWRGYSVKALHCLSEVVSRCPDRGVKVYVFDIDALTEEFANQHIPGIQLGGWGETFWIQNGKIKHVLLRYSAEQMPTLEDYTRSIADGAIHS
jgi:hypothetical protein